MIDKQRRLEALVKAGNRSHKAANELYNQLVPIFRPMIGQKITKADGYLLAKVASQLPEFPSTPSLQIFRMTSDYSLAWCVKTNEQNSDYTCVYVETSVYIGKLDGDKLVEIIPPARFRDDYTAEEIKTNREAYEEAKERAANALSKLYPFGERD